MVKSRQITREEIEFYDSCNVCNKEIKGSTEKQVEYNLDIHMKAKHRRGDE